MRPAAYVDSSVLVAIVAGEPAASALLTTLDDCEEVFATNLLEAELRSATFRKCSPADLATVLDGIRWVHPDRPLRREFARVLAHGHLRGADLWHVACALFLGEVLAPVPFLTLDARQREVAAAVGLQIAS
jgi:predicted nucleic acid-binding protein